MWFTLVVLALLSRLSLNVGSPLQVINVDGTILGDGKLGSLVATAVRTDKPVQLVDILDCTGSGGCVYLDQMLGTSFASSAGITLQSSSSLGILMSRFSSMYSAGLCGSKAVDYQCALHSSKAHSSICVAMNAIDLKTALNSYDQVFKRIASYAHERKQRHGRPVQVIMLVDESGVPAELESNVQEYTNTVESFLQGLWSDLHGEAMPSNALQVKVVVVKADSAVLLAQAKASFDDVLVEDRNSLTAVDRISQSVGGAEELDDHASEGLDKSQLARVLASAWNALPVTPRPVLTKSEQDGLFAIETAFATCMSLADVSIGQWQGRVASGRIVGKFAQRAQQLLTAVRKDFHLRAATGEALQLVRERGERLRMLREHVLVAANRLFMQQLMVAEFAVVDGFRKDIARLAAREDLSEEVLKEQEQAALRKAVFLYRTKVTDLEDSALGLTLSEERVAELTATLENILRDFPESPTAKLEEVRKVERLARRGKAGGDMPATGRGRKRKGLAKALGVSLGLVGMLRPPGYGNLQGFIGYATSLLGLPLDLLLGVQNDGDAPEILGEDREYPILRLQPKIKFDIDLQ